MAPSRHHFVERGLGVEMDPEAPRGDDDVQPSELSSNAVHGRLDLSGVNASAGATTALDPSSSAAVRKRGPRRAMGATRPESRAKRCLVIR